MQIIKTEKDFFKVTLVQHDLQTEQRTFYDHEFIGPFSYVTGTKNKLGKIYIGGYLSSEFILSDQISILSNINSEGEIPNGKYLHILVGPKNGKTHINTRTFWEIILEPTIEISLPEDGYVLTGIFFNEKENTKFPDTLEDLKKILARPVGDPTRGTKVIPPN